MRKNCITLLLVLLIPIATMAVGKGKAYKQRLSPYSTSGQGVHAVDLGLPSGTLWADRNVGADAPEAAGGFFEWGETIEVTVRSGDYFDQGYTKYNNATITELLPEDDAAYRNMGKNWRMPTAEQFKELTDYCTWEFSRVDDKDYAIATGPNGNTLVLPYPGTYLDPKYEDAYPPVAASFVHYWTRSLSGDDGKARYVNLGTSSGGGRDGYYTSVNFSHTSDYRENCHAIRAVYEPSQPGDAGDDEEGEVNCLVLWHKDGYKVHYLFAEKPVVSFVDDKIIVEDNTTRTEYDYEAISKMTYEVDDPAGIKNVEENKKTETSFTHEGENFVFQAGNKPLQVQVVTVNGVLIKAFTVGADSMEMLSVKSLPRGINIISVNGATYKINVR